MSTPGTYTLRTIRQNRRGHTLTELLLYMGLLAVFITLITQIFTTVVSTRLETSSYSAVSQDGRFILTRLAQDLRNSQTIVTPANPGNTSASLTLTKNGDTLIYAMSGNNLRVSINGTPYQINSSGTSISNLLFRRLGSGPKATIRTTFTVTSVNTLTSGTESRPFEVTAGIR